MNTQLRPPRARLRQFLAAAGVAFALGWQPAAAAPEGKLVMNMRDADIRSLIQWVADVTGKNIVVHKDVQGTVTVLSAEPVTPEQAYQVFLATLDVHGFAAIDDGSAIKIVPASMANASNPPIGQGSAAHGETIVSVIRANNVPAEKLATNLRPLVPQTAMLTAYPETNSLIVASSASNVQRVNELVRMLDQGGNLQFETIRLQHANAQDVERNLGQLIPGLAGAEGYKFVNLAVDTRTNTILLGGEPANRRQVRNIIASLDQEVAGGNTDVIYLKYVQAEEMLAILKGIAEALQDGGGGGGGQGGGGGAPAPKVSIEASKSTNALIINAPPAIVAKMRSIVGQVDVRRPQVLVEALVVEVSDDDAKDLGVSWVTSLGDDNPLDDGQIGVNTLGSALGNGTITDDDGKTLFRPGGGLTLGYFQNGDLKAVLRALAGSTKTNVLSNPTIVALDNEEAELLVGQNVPFKTGEALTEGTTSANPFTTIERQDIGLKLVIKPQINQAAETITLDLKQSTEAIVNSADVTEDQTSDIITRKRSIMTKALIKDQQTLVIGGLIEDREDITRSMVPILGNIPLVGHLFGSTSKNKSKVNLVVFIHPTILKDEEQMASITRQRYEAMRAQQAVALEPDGPFERKPPPEMPDFETFTPR
jgi:general secretion pathway protein D